MISDQADNLQQELMETDDLDRFLSKHADQFQCRDTARALQALFQSRNMSKTALAERSCVSVVYLHQLFSGKRRPTRERILCICFGLQATVEEAQELLKACGFAMLYVRDRREAIVLHCLHHGCTLEDANMALHSRGFQPLSEKL